MTGDFSEGEDLYRSLVDHTHENASVVVGLKIILKYSISILYPHCISFCSSKAAKQRVPSQRKHETPTAWSA